MPQARARKDPLRWRWRIGRRWSLLAHRAVKSGSAALDNAPDAAATSFPQASRALTVVDAEPIREIRRVRCRRAVTLLPRKAPRDRLVQHLLDRRHQMPRRSTRATHPCRDRGGTALRRQAGAIERFADIDVAEPGDDTLIRKRSLQRGL